MNTRVDRLHRRIGTASRVELEYFCRDCKGHFSSSVPLSAIDNAHCRCGSGDLLVYAMSGDMSAPMRYRG
jgi:hypothetical protein